MCSKSKRGQPRNGANGKGATPGLCADPRVLVPPGAPLQLSKCLRKVSARIRIEANIACDGEIAGALGAHLGGFLQTPSAHKYNRSSIAVRCNHELQIQLPIATQNSRHRDYRLGLGLFARLR